MPYLLHLPRRHRRRLFFPPGLLALAWLLWLGCVAISKHPAADWEPKQVFAVYPPTLGPTFYADALTTQLELREPAISMGGTVWADYFAYQQLDAFNTSTDTANSYVTVLIRPHASYAGMVATVIKLSSNSEARFGFYKSSTSSALAAVFHKSRLPGRVDCLGMLMSFNASASTAFPKVSRDESRKGVGLGTLLCSSWRAPTLFLLLLALVAALKLQRLATQ